MLLGAAGPAIARVVLRTRARAARKIMAAVRDRRGHVGLQAKVLRLMHDLFPTLTTRLLDVGHRLLPGAPATPAARG